MKPIELPTLAPAGTAPVGPRGAHPHGRRGARARRGAERRDPRPQLPGARGAGRGPLRGRLARPVAPRGRHGRRRDRLLRRPLHGRDGVDPLARQDRPPARPRRRLLARRLDHRGPAPRVEGQAPGRDRRHVREHDRRGEGGDRLLLHVGERGAGGGAHLPRARRRHRDPVRAGHVAGRVRRAHDREADARLGRRVPRARRDPAGRHHGRARGAPGRRVHDPPRVRLHHPGDGVRGRRRRGPRAHAHALDRRDAAVRARLATPTPSSSPPRRACCTRSRRRTPARSSSRRTARRRAAT